MSIRFAETDVRPMGRSAFGVRGITLRDGDAVVAMEVLRPGGTILSVTEQGYGKRTELDEYSVQSAAVSGSSTSRPAIGTARSLASFR